MPRKINDEGLELIKRWEGLVLYAYDDRDGARPPKPIKAGDKVRGKLTIGYGHTRSAHRGQVITEAEAERLLREDISSAEAAVERLVSVPLNDQQFAALVSFVFNVGETAFGKSTLRRKLNAGDYAAAPGELMRWVYDDGKRVEGLVNRRAQEAALWGKGEFVASNYVSATPAAPPIDREAISWAATIISSLGAALAGSGPVQWAFAALILAAGATALFFFIRKRWRPA